MPVEKQVIPYNDRSEIYTAIRYAHEGSATAIPDAVAQFRKVVLEYEKAIDLMLTVQDFLYPLSRDIKVVQHKNGAVQVDFPDGSGVISTPFTLPDTTVELQDTAAEESEVADPANNTIIDADFEVTPAEAVKVVNDAVAELRNAPAEASADPEQHKDEIAEMRELIGHTLALGGKSLTRLKEVTGYCQSDVKEALQHHWFEYKDRLWELSVTGYKKFAQAVPTA